jgi:hypothetical protein
MKSRVSPKDCAIAVCIPLEQADFIRQFHLANEGSFVYENTLDSGPRIPAEVHWGCYQSQARFFKSVLEEAGKAGVRVVLNATMRDFHLLLQENDVVTLVAQWKSARFRASDLIDRLALSNALRQSSLAIPTSANLPCDFRHDDTEKILQYLNQALLPNTPLQPPRHELGRSSYIQTLMHERRKEIESKMPALFAGGASVEFYEGFHNIDEIIDGLPQAMSCLLDLTVCNSLTLAHEIKKVRPTSYILCNEEITHLTFRAAIYRQVIRKIKRQPCNFEEATFSIRKLLYGERSACS